MSSPNQKKEEKSETTKIIEKYTDSVLETAKTRDQLAATFVKAAKIQNQLLDATLTRCGVSVDSEDEKEKK
ncbi:hypothetical protein QBC43DRAFT_293599 [Cladorrhinum sp. PSN259]|nr:hypothetical protein QBC43DRAFT_293599 [Cladorrhinum sp. PSN259]